jgi:hypothetical protein
MTTSIDPTRLRRPSYADDAVGTPTPQPDDRAVRRAADERLNVIISKYQEFGPCDAIPKPVLLRTESGDQTPVDLRDIQQRGFGDCFVLAPLGGLTRTPEGRALIANAVAENRNERGEVLSYTVTLHVPQQSLFSARTSREIKVTIDPSFECGHARPRIENGSAEMWPVVIEAAFAKLAGGYRTIQEGYPSVAMEVLTGEPATRERLGGWFGRRYDAATLRADLAAGKIVVFETNRDVGPVTCQAPPDQQDKMNLPGAYGLHGDHAYLAMGTETRNGKEYLLLHNPWNKSQPDAVPFDELGDWFKAVDVGSVK